MIPGLTSDSEPAAIWLGGRGAAAVGGEPIAVNCMPPVIFVGLWYPRPDLNRNLRFRKPLLYPVELRGQVINYQ